MDIELAKSRFRDVLKTVSDNDPTIMAQAFKARMQAVHEGLFELLDMFRDVSTEDPVTTVDYDVEEPQPPLEIVKITLRSNISNRKNLPSIIIKIGPRYLQANVDPNHHLNTIQPIIIDNPEDFKHGYDKIQLMLQQILQTAND